MSFCLPNAAKARFLNSQRNPTSTIFLENQLNYFEQLKYFLHRMLAASEHRRSDGAGAKKELVVGGCPVANCKLNTIQTRSQYAE